MIAESHSSEQIIDMADGMMYEVKHGTKDNVQAAVWDGISFRKTWNSIRNNPL